MDAVQIEEIIRMLANRGEGPQQPGEKLEEFARFKQKLFRDWSF